jgi:hypothetical protein
LNEHIANPLPLRSLAPQDPSVSIL